MSTKIEPYPGSTALPADVMALADEYSRAAEALISARRPRQVLSLAPARLCAIHSIELYLNAFLMHCGTPPADIRKQFQFHDLASRTKLAVDRGLILRKRTTEHLSKMTETREYLISRYAPERIDSELSQINRLMATVREIAQKVGSHLTRGAHAPSDLLLDSRSML